MKRQSKIRNIRKSAKTRARFTPFAGLVLLAAAFILVGTAIFFMGNIFPQKYERANAESVKSSTASVPSTAPVAAPLNTFAYDTKLASMSHVALASTTLESVRISTTTPKLLWPVKAAYPLAGAILPFKRVIAYYGNLYSKQMGVLGEYPKDTMFQKLDAEVKKWEAADPSTPVVPALDYIAVTAQGSAGADGMYRLRMPDSQIDTILSMASEIHAIVFLDIQPGLSNLESELPQYEKYLKMPQVHLAIDPEFSMKTGAKPGTVIGTMDAADVNYAANYLAKLVKDNNLPPKILVVHRFTEGMVTNYKQIKPLPEVQIVMDMDGWGSQARKINTYRVFVQAEPVQFTGFKLFYKNDLKEDTTTLLTPAQLLKLTPQPMYIQFQ